LFELTWRYEERSGRTGLSRLTLYANLRGLTRPTGRRLIWPDGSAPKNRHHHQPSISELIIANDGVAVIRGLARAAEAFEDRVSRDGTVQDLARRLEPLAFLREDRHPCIDDLEDVIFSDG
jgi:hypothetical protein